MKVKEEFYNYIFEEGINCTTKKLDECLVGDTRFSLEEIERKPVDSTISFRTRQIKDDEQIFMSLGVRNPYKSSFWKSFLLEYQNPFEDIVENLFDILVKKEEDKKIQGYYEKKDPGLSLSLYNEGKVAFIHPKSDKLSKEEAFNTSLGFIKFDDPELNIKIGKDIINFFSGEETELIGVKK